MAMKTFVNKILDKYTRFFSDDEIKQWKKADKLKQKSKKSNK